MVHEINLINDSTRVEKGLVWVKYLADQYYHDRPIQLCINSNLSDIDECALGISGCNQICTNTNGSYTCSCYLGYQISSNNRTCSGEH